MALKRFHKTAKIFLFTLMMGLSGGFVGTTPPLLAEETLAEEELEVQKKETDRDIEAAKKQTKDDLLRKPARDKRKELKKDLQKKLQWKKLF